MNHRILALLVLSISACSSSASDDAQADGDAGADAAPPDAAAAADAASEVAVETGPPPGSLGTECGDDVACLQGECVNARCRIAFPSCYEAECPETDRCFPTGPPTSDGYRGVCIPEGEGHRSTALGESCFSDYDC